MPVCDHLTLETWLSALAWTCSPFPLGFPYLEDFENNQAVRKCWGSVPRLPFAVDLNVSFHFLF